MGSTCSHSNNCCCFRDHLLQDMTSLGNNLVDDDDDDDTEQGLSPDGELSSSYESEFGTDPSTSMFYHLSIREALMQTIVNTSGPPGGKRHSNSVPVFSPTSSTNAPYSTTTFGMLCMPLGNNPSHRENFRRALRNCLDRMYWLVTGSKRRQTLYC